MPVAVALPRNRRNMGKLSSRRFSHLRVNERLTTTSTDDNDDDDDDGGDGKLDTRRFVLVWRKFN